LSVHGDLGRGYEKMIPVRRRLMEQGFLNTYKIKAYFNTDAIKQDYWLSSIEKNAGFFGKLKHKLSTTSSPLCMTKVSRHLRSPKVFKTTCHLSGWRSWGACSHSCGGGVQNRKAAIVTGSDHCPGSVQQKVCNTHVCPINCVHEWRMWGDCSVSCAGGVQTRLSVIKSPAQFGGFKCPESQQRTCNTYVCPTPSPTVSPTPAPTPPPTPAKSTPVITLVSTGSITVEASTDKVYTDKGAKCADAIWGDLTSGITTDSNVKLDQVTMWDVPYRVRYSCTNPAPWRIKSTATRIVHVQDTICPTCSSFATTVTVEAGFAFKDSAIPVCTDNIDGKVKTISKGTVSGLHAGTYYLTYTARDKSGNSDCASPMVRTVLVQDTLKPVISLKFGDKFIHIGSAKDKGSNGEKNPAVAHFGPYGQNLMAERTMTYAWCLASAVAVASVALAAFANTKTTAEDLSV